MITVERHEDYEQITGEELPFDHEAKDELISEALAYLDRNGVGYIPLAGEEDAVDEAYDAPEEVFREPVRGWLSSLVEAERVRRMA